eukprot:TRINITY_DN2680_c0_g1_i1.p1 TRINITY_DN2680_c0_g1~~TRINITY_DN2680_c0_g1_i1.p1  ORF type:complete len:580 (+),score=257.25 TRINITY_DN2680_c0_g1_i1:91-1830(+)
MVYTILAAVDLGGKCNFELIFAGKPSVAELRARIDRDIGTEAALRRPNVPFAVSRVQIFDERLQMWVDLVAAVQLEDYCQLYVFQVESPYCRDLPGHIPPPQRPATAGSPQVGNERHVSPQRFRAPSPMNDPAPPPPPPEMSPYRQRQREIDLRAMPESPAPALPEKVRLVYDDLDNTRSRRVTLEDWRAAFTRLRICGEGGLTQDTVDDLFSRKADRNQDSIVTFQEFARFAELYPKLLDCLYYRSRALIHENARKDNLEKARAEADALDQKHEQAGRELEDQKSQVAQQDEKLQAALAEVKRHQEQEAEAKRERDEAQQEAERKRDELRGKIADRDKAKDAVRGKDADLRQQQRAVAAAEKKRDQKQGDVDRVQKEMDRLQQLLKQQEQELARQQDQLSDAASKVDEEGGKAAKIEEEKQNAEGEAQAAQDEVTRVEGELKGLQDDLSDRTKALREVQREVQSAQAQAEREAKELQANKLKEEAKIRAKERAEEALEEHRKVVTELAQKDEEADEKRKGEQEKESAIVEAEIRLREQRDAVEEKEHALAQAANDFAAETGRVLSPPQGQRFGSSSPM